MAATLIPFGSGHTYFGEAARSASFSLLAATAAYTAGCLLCFTIFRRREIFSAIGGRMERIVFQSRASLFLTAVATLGFAAAATASWELFRHLPGVPDSIAQYVHARLLADGRLFAPGEPLAEFFPFPTAVMNFQERWFSQYPPGHLLSLAAGHALGVPFLVNPALGAAATASSYFLAKQVCDERIARITALLMLLSPFVLLTSAEYMSHATSLLAATLFLFFMLKARKSLKWRHGALAGAMLGWLFITRPYTACLVALPVFIWALRPGFFSTPKIVAAGFLAFAPWALFQLFFNAATTGNPLTYGYIVRFGPTHVPGFSLPVPGDMRWYASEPLTLWRAIGQLSNNLIGLNLYLFAWPIPALTFVIVAAVYCLRTRETRLLASVPASLALGHAFYFYQDWCFGPRFLYEGTPMLAMLTALGMRHAAAVIRSRGWIRARQAYPLFLLALFVAGTPFFVTQKSLSADHGLKEAFRPPVLRLVHGSGLVKALVFVPAELYPAVATTFPPHPRDSIIYAVDNGARNALLITRYPDRAAYVWEAGTLKRIGT